MRLGNVQKDIVRLLYRRGTSGCFIGSTTKAEELQGLDLEQVERAMEGLKRRRIIYRDGIATKLMEWVYAKYSADEIKRITAK